MSYSRGLLVEDGAVSERIDCDFGEPKPAAALFGAVTSLPGEAMDLAQNLVTFRDQLSSSSCTGHAICRAADARLRVQGKIVPYGSPLAAYTVGRTLSLKTPGEKLEDFGAYTRLVMEGVRQWGVAPESEWSLTSETINAKLPPDVLQRASAWKIEDYFRIYATGSSRVDAFCKALADRYPLVVETYTDDAFNAYRGKGVIPAPTAKVAPHAVCVLGYRTVDGKRQFLIGNSWGGWGLSNSLGWASEEWVMATIGAYALTFTLGPASGGPAFPVNENNTITDLGDVVGPDSGTSNVVVTSAPIIGALDVEGDE